MTRTRLILAALAVVLLGTAAECDPVRYTDAAVDLPEAPLPHAQYVLNVDQRAGTAQAFGVDYVRNRVNANNLDAVDWITICVRGAHVNTTTLAISNVANWACETWTGYGLNWERTVTQTIAPPGPDKAVFVYDHKVTIRYLHPLLGMVTRTCGRATASDDGSVPCQFL